MNKSQQTGWIIVGCAFVLIVLVWFRFSFSSPASTTHSKSFDNEVSLIALNGIITSHSIGGFGSSGSSIIPSNVKDLLNQAATSKSSLLVITISSPGGSVAPTQEIYDHMVEFKERTGKEIYVWMRDVAASGGYYIACPADQLFAMPSTITGSIGVILQLINYENLLEKIGIQEKTFKSGRFKDLGSPGRPLEKDEQELLQTLVDEQYELFFQTVMKHRNIPEEQLRGLAQGQIFTGNQARENGLIDEVMGWYEMERMIKAKMEWEGDIHWVEHKSKTNWWSWLDARIPVSDLNLWNLIKRSPSMQFEYLWRP